MKTLPQNKTVSHLNSLAYNMGQIAQNDKSKKQWYCERYQETVNHLFDNKPSIIEWLNRKRPWWKDILIDLHYFSEIGLQVIPLTGQKLRNGEVDPKGTTVQWRDGMYDYAVNPPIEFPLFLDFVRHTKKPQIGVMMTRDWFCVDCDSADSVKLFNKIKDDLSIQANMTVKTRRGRHYYFKGNEQIISKIQRKIKLNDQKIDIIVDGYVTAPGFKHETGETNEIIESTGALISDASLHCLLKRLGYTASSNKITAMDAIDILDDLSRVGPVAKTRSKEAPVLLPKKPLVRSQASEPATMGDLCGASNIRSLTPELQRLVKQFPLRNKNRVDAHCKLVLKAHHSIGLQPSNDTLWLTEAVSYAAQIDSEDMENQPERTILGIHKYVERTWNPHFDFKSEKRYLSNRAGAWAKRFLIGLVGRKADFGLEFYGYAENKLKQRGEIYIDEKTLKLMAEYAGVSVRWAKQFVSGILSKWELTRNYQVGSHCRHYAPDGMKWSWSEWADLDERARKNLLIKFFYKPVIHAIKRMQISLINSISILSYRCINYVVHNTVPSTLYPAIWHRNRAGPD